MKCCNSNKRIFWISTMTMWGLALGIVTGVALMEIIK